MYLFSLQHEATNFNMDWKVPCSVFFIKKNIVKSYDIQGMLLTSAFIKKKVNTFDHCVSKKEKTVAVSMLSGEVYSIQHYAYQ
jgi:hypothetical protein